MALSYEAIAVELCDNFDRDIQQAINYCDAISSLLLVDHGYFRFDDDLKMLGVKCIQDITLISSATTLLM